MLYYVLVVLPDSKVNLCCEHCVFYCLLFVFSLFSFFVLFVLFVSFVRVFASFLFTAWGVL